MTHIWMVRHGPTHEKNLVGWRDVPADLSDQGLIDRVHNYLPQDAIVVASDLLRARTTADAIGKNRLRLPDDPALREFNFGLWDGMTFQDVADKDPDLSRKFWEEPGDLAPPEGESWNMVAARVTQALDRLTRAYPNKDIIVVAHIGVIMTQIQRATASTAYAAMGHHIDNLSVTDMRWDGDGWIIGQINHIP